MFFPSFLWGWWKVDRFYIANHKFLEPARLAKTRIKMVLVYNEGILFKAERASVKLSLHSLQDWGWQEGRGVDKTDKQKTKKTGLLRLQSNGPTLKFNGDRSCVEETWGTSGNGKWLSKACFLCSARETCRASEFERHRLKLHTHAYTEEFTHTTLLHTEDVWCKHHFSFFAV